MRSFCGLLKKFCVVFKIAASFGARLPLYGTGSKHQCRHGNHNSGKSKTQCAVDGSLQVSSNPLTHSKSQNELCFVTKCTHTTTFALYAWKPWIRLKPI